MSIYTYPINCHAWRISWLLLIFITMTLFWRKYLNVNVNTKISLRIQTIFSIRICKYRYCIFYIFLHQSIICPTFDDRETSVVKIFSFFYLVSRKSGKTHQNKHTRWFPAEFHRYKIWSRELYPNLYLLLWWKEYSFYVENYISNVYYI